ncbi:hypothetical protein HY641_01165 [Candidatus Woesearchaeota archaeon]|nr:hypothetical protein [Candidatus Woesearchaeota archaeon]
MEIDKPVDVPVQSDVAQEHHPSHEAPAHSDREARRKQRDEEREREHQAVVSKKRNKRILQWTLAAIILIGLVNLFYRATVGGEKPYTATEIHWHADVQIELCGVRKDLPRVPAGAGHFGTPLTHTHDDNKLHLEGRIFKKRDANVGLFLDAIGVDFSESELYGKRGGDVCDGVPGRVRAFLNDDEVSVAQMQEYVIKDGDVVKLTFAP